MRPDVFEVLKKVGDEACNYEQKRVMQFYLNKAEREGLLLPDGNI